MTFREEAALRILLLFLEKRSEGYPVTIAETMVPTAVEIADQLAKVLWPLGEEKSSN